MFITDNFNTFSNVLCSYYSVCMFKFHRQWKYSRFSSIDVLYSTVPIIDDIKFESTYLKEESEKWVYRGVENIRTIFILFLCSNETTGENIQDG